MVYGLFAWMPYAWINALRAGAMKLFKHVHTKKVYKIAHPNNGIFPILRDTFEDLVEHRFEDYRFFIPRQYDRFLRERYGDYMKIPPESEVYDCCTSIIECEL